MTTNICTVKLSQFQTKDTYSTAKFVKEKWKAINETCHVVKKNKTELSISYNEYVQMDRVQQMCIFYNKNEQNH
jgi:hypothetical protein